MRGEIPPLPSEPCNSNRVKIVLLDHLASSTYPSRLFSHAMKQPRVLSLRAIRVKGCSESAPDRESGALCLTFGSLTLEVGRSILMNIRLVLWTLCMGFAGFLLSRGTPSITSTAMLGLCIGAGIGVALGIMFTHRANRKQGVANDAPQRNQERRTAA